MFGGGGINDPPTDGVDTDGVEAKGVGRFSPPENPPGVVGGGADLDAASIAFALKSLSSPANMIPDNVPVRNVAIGIINSKNLLSTGLIPFIG